MVTLVVVKGTAVVATGTTVMAIGTAMVPMGTTAVIALSSPGPDFPHYSKELVPVLVFCRLSSSFPLASSLMFKLNKKNKQHCGEIRFLLKMKQTLQLI